MRSKQGRKPALAVLVLAPLAGLLVISSAGAAPIVQSSWGATLSCVADPAGYCVVKHPAGVVPDDVVVTPTAPAITSVDQRTAATFRVRFYRAIAQNGSVTALPGEHTFGVHVDWGAGPFPTPSTDRSSPVSPPPPPSSIGFPNGSNTGVPAGAVLATVNDNIRITTANTVIDSKDIHGCVLVQAPGVIIRRSRITCPGYISVMSKASDYRGAGVLLEDDEITCANGPGTAIGDTNITARRLNVHGCENGFDIDVAVDVEDSYIHDLWNGPDAHADGLQLAVGHDVTIKHNTIYSSGTSSIINPDTGASNVLIEYNLLGGGAYSLYCQQTASGANFRVINNRFSRRFYPTGGAYGPAVYCADESVVTGNVWEDTGQAVTMT